MVQSSGICQPPPPQDAKSSVCRSRPWAEPGLIHTLDTHGSQGMVLRAVPVGTPRTVQTTQNLLNAKFYGNSSSGAGIWMLVRGQAFLALLVHGQV